MTSGIYQRTEETKQKMRKPKSEEHRKNISLGNKGKIISREIRRKMSETMKGKHFSPKTEFKKGIHNSLVNEFKKGEKKELFSEQTKLKMSLSSKGKPKSEEARKRMSETRKRLFKEGKLKIWSYIDGRSKWMGPARYGDDWDKIRYLIYLRDKFICQSCGAFGIKLHVHHKVPFLTSFDNSLNNLITLCASCHRKEDAIIIKEIKMIRRD